MTGDQTLECGCAVVDARRVYCGVHRWNHNLMPLTDEEIHTLERWAKHPSIFSPGLVSHRHLLARAAHQLKCKGQPCLCIWDR